MQEMHMNTESHFTCQTVNLQEVLSFTHTVSAGVAVLKDSESSYVQISEAETI